MSPAWTGELALPSASAVALLEPGEEAAGAVIPLKSNLDDIRSFIRGKKSSIRAASRARKKADVEKEQAISRDLDKFVQECDARITQALSVPLPHSDVPCQPCAEALPTLHWQQPGARMGQACYIAILYAAASYSTYSCSAAAHARAHSKPCVQTSTGGETFIFIFFVLRESESMVTVVSFKCCVAATRVTLVTLACLKA